MHKARTFMKVLAAAALVAAVCSALAAAPANAARDFSHGLQITKPAFAGFAFYLIIVSMSSL